MSDSKTTIEGLKNQVREFCEARDWDQFHGAKDLAIGLVTESSELLELFRFKDKSEVEAQFQNSEERIAIEEEMSDVFFFLLRLAQRYDIDLVSASLKKMEKNAKRYPVEEFRGKNHKSSR